MNNITPIINAEAQKYINEFMKKGNTEEESIRLSLDKVKDLKKENPLVVIFWEVEKALIDKQLKLRTQNGRI
jgi:hypothetical protein